jgi:hypothetical protein
VSEARARHLCHMLIAMPLLASASIGRYLDFYNSRRGEHVIAVRLSETGYGCALALVAFLVRPGLISRFPAVPRVYSSQSPRLYRSQSEDWLNPSQSAERTSGPWI